MDETSVNPEPATDPKKITIIGKGGASHTSASGDVTAFDFDGTSCLTPQEMRKLKQIHEDFVKKGKILFSEKNKLIKIWI